MKNLLSLCIVGLIALTALAADIPPSKKAGKAKAKVTVTRTWLEKSDDSASFKTIYDIPCEVQAEIEVYETERQEDPVGPGPHEVKVPKVDPEDAENMWVATCKTSYKTGEPVEIKILATLTYLWKNGRPYEKVYMGTMFFSENQKKEEKGAFAVFTTKDVSLKNGSLVMGGLGSSDDIYKDTHFGSSVEIQE